jgi:hypothetical protein
MFSYLYSLMLLGDAEFFESVEFLDDLPIGQSAGEVANVGNDRFRLPRVVWGRGR